MLGLPSLSGKAGGLIKNIGTGSILKSTGTSLLFNILGNSGKWGIYKASSGSKQPSFLQNAGQVLLSTPILNKTLGDFIGGGDSDLNPVVSVDSVMMIDSRYDTQVSDYRIEMGGYVSYNKIPNPEAVSIVISKGGTISDRMQLLDWLEKSVEATTVYDIVVPEKVYKDMTLESFEIMREAQTGGNSLIDAKCVFRKIRTVTPILPTASTENAQSANDTPTAAPESVQAKEVSMLDKATAAVKDGYNTVVDTVQTGWNAIKESANNVVSDIQSTVEKVASETGITASAVNSQGADIPEFWR